MINVIGLGYIGLPTALMLAAHGQEVIGTDLSEDVVNALKQGKVGLMEDGIEQLYCRAVAGGIRFSTEYQRAEVYIISVPTPYIQETKCVDFCFYRCQTCQFTGFFASMTRHDFVTAIIFLAEGDGGDNAPVLHLLKVWKLLPSWEM